MGEMELRERVSAQLHCRWHRSAGVIVLLFYRKERPILYATEKSHVLLTALYGTPLPLLVALANSL